MSEFRVTGKGFSWLLVAAAALGVLFGTQAVAQSDADDSEEEVVDIDRIQVTGSLLRRDEYTSASPLTVITADTKITQGLVDAADFLQTSSVAAGSTQLNHQFGGFVTEGGTGAQSISLRGLGARRTLVLMNNRRPGPAGTRGQVAAFDLNVIPSSIIQRAEILKDGASSIYGSDAVAGVVNIITRSDIDSPELSISANMPFESGGERFSASGATGWQFDSGSIVLAGEWYLHRPLRLGDRDYLKCAEDLVYDANGNRIDREDRSIIGNTELGGCSAGNLYANTVIDAFTGLRYIPSPDGVTEGLIPGYRPRNNPTYASGGPAYFEDVLNFDFIGQEHLIDRQERFSVFSRAEFNFGNVDWDAEFLYNRRKTKNMFWRQFFPLTGGATAPAAYQYANAPDFVTPVPSGVAQVVMPFPWTSEVEIDYYYLTTGIEGAFGRNWNWRVDASYSYSDGDYTRKDSIVASRSGDVQYDPNGPAVDYFSPCALSGACMDDVVRAVSASHTGNTVYDQFVLNGVVAGDIFNLPAGAVGLAVGAEYRQFSIDDTPSDLTLAGDLWGESGAGRTKGDDSVMEAFAELEIPILAGRPGFESLTFNGSIRAFDYDSVSGSDFVWKAGLNWQITPTVRLRATRGTSYRAPGLFELYLADQTGFVGQTGIDPCVDWGNKTNEFLRANCAAVGVPPDYTGAGSSALVISSGGQGVLDPETSDALTAGIVLTPTFANFNVAVDYFEFEIKDEISQLGAGNIVAGCYNAPVFPNAFCNFIDRFPSDHPVRPNQIETVRNPYLNINRQKTRGFDLSFRYDGDYAFGRLEVEGEATYTFDATRELFDAASGGDGFTSDDLLGLIGRPQWVGNMRTALKRNDWTYTWFMDYVGRTKNDERVTNEIFNYLGYEGARRDIQAGRRIYHGVSVLYNPSEQWSVLAGIRNIFDHDPPLVSDGAGATRVGNIPLFATQYDVYGRTGYVRFNYKF